MRAAGMARCLGARSRPARRARPAAPEGEPQRPLPISPRECRVEHRLSRYGDGVGALLEPRDLGPCGRQIDVDVDLVRRDTDRRRRVERRRRPRVAAPGPNEPQHDERLVVRPRRLSWILQDTVGEVGRLGPASPVECVPRRNGECVDPPSTRCARRSTRSPAGCTCPRAPDPGGGPEAGEVVERSRDLFGEPGDSGLGDRLRASGHARVGTSRRSSIVASPTSAVTAVRASPQRRAISRACAGDLGAADGIAVDPRAHRPVCADERHLAALFQAGDQSGRLVESPLCLPEQPSAEEVRAELRQISSLASR